MEISGILGALPTFIYVAAWTVAVVFAMRMVRSNGGRPERFLVIGASLMLASSVVKCAWAVSVPWLMPRLIEAGTDHKTISLMFSAVSFVCACISLAGIVFLVYAFWQKFKKRPTSVVSD